MGPMDEGEAQYLDEIGRHPLLSAVEERALARRIQDGDVEARNELVTRNLRFVPFIAKRYRGRGVSFFGLIQEGNLGLLRAAERYNPGRGRFTTYAAYWIRREIGRALDQGAGILSVPSSAAHLAFRFQRGEATLEVASDRAPTEDEIARVAGLKPEQVRTAQLVFGARGKRWGPRIGGPGSLPFVVCRDERFVLRKEPPDCLQSELKAALEALSRREQVCMALRFPEDGTRPFTFREIGSEIDRTHERARQIIEGAIQKLLAQLGGD